AITRIFRQVPVATELNRGALNDPRVTVENADAFRYLAEVQTSFDLAVVDFPDPSNYALGKLYTLTFYRRLRERLNPRGVVVVQSTSPYYARRSYWSIAATLEAAEFKVLPFHLYVPSFGEWGFVIGGGSGVEAPTDLRLPETELVFLRPALLPSLFTFTPDTERVDAPINRLNDQALVSIYTREWETWSR
ncbi:MAG: polyamine aminopropyltransferase, partial [Myxococcota bacterium]